MEYRNYLIPLPAEKCVAHQFCLTNISGREIKGGRARRAEHTVIVLVTLSLVVIQVTQIVQQARTGGLPVQLLAGPDGRGA